MEAIALTLPMMVVLGLLAFTVVLFVSEIVRIDFAAILVKHRITYMSVGIDNLRHGRH